jgi:predicted ATPase
MVVEDLHWMDATTAEFVDALIDRLADVPALMMLTRRPGATAPKATAVPPDQSRLPPP